MKFVVCVKLTPDTEQLAEIQPEDIRAGDLGVTMVLNPWDEFAVEEALLLQERFDGETVAITLGGADAIEALKRAVAMGIETPQLLSDPIFYGSDVWGTAHVLAQAIRKIGDATLILTGARSVDSASGLLAPGLAAKLEMPFVSQVVKILDLSAESVTVQRALDEGVQTVRVKTPAVLAVSKQINEPRYANFVGIRKASRMSYPAMNAQEIPGLDARQMGGAAALVEWADLGKPPTRAGACELIQSPTVREQAEILADRLIAEKVI